MMYANTCSEWIKAMSTIINAQIVYSKCVPSVVVDSCRMMISRTMMISIGECRVGQTQHGAAKSMRNFMHSGAVMTVGHLY